jgi:glycosyltransferase involved in cell wall biosynthesis
VSTDAGRPVRVTQLVFDLHGGGMESLVAAMAAHWQGSAVRSSVITLSGRVGRVGETVRGQVEQYIVLQPGALSMVAPLGLARAIRRTRPDVVHLHSGAWYKGALPARIAGVRRVVYTEHGREHYDPALMQRLDRLASRWTHVVAPVSDRLGRYLANTVGVDPRRIVTVPNGVDAKRFAPGSAPDALRAALGIPPDALVLGSVGRFEPVKGYDRLVTAFAELRGKVAAPLYLVMFGDGIERAALNAQVDRLGIREWTRLPGWNENPVQCYRLLDVFALTSHSEGASVSLMEAMACGRVPVAMDVGANAEIMGPSLQDLVTPASDVPAFVATAAATLARDDRATLGDVARARVMERYTFRGMVEHYEALYRGGPEARG